ncbi:MAG: calcium/sodium antiporter [Patescibacteria group bacterium]|nr:calcium/sodium antiporter [Patescibacteria group bacterium]
MLNVIILLIAGLIGLTVGAKMVVDSGKAVAHRLGVSELFIGLTIVSIGTSLPEIMVSVFSGVKEASDIAIGTMVGSCLTQITLILGIAGLIHNIKADRKAIRVDGTMLLLAIVLFWLTLFTGGIMTPFEAVILILIYIAYLVFTARHDSKAKEVAELGSHERQGFPIGLRILFLVIGFGILIFSGNLVLDNSLLIAEYFDLSAAFVGVMIIGVATCLPELSTAVIAAFQGASGIAIGALIGSNITDPLLSASIGALFNGFEAGNHLLYFDIPVWFLGSVLALSLLHRKKLTLFRWEAAALIVFYLGFVGVKIGFGL